MIVGVTGLIGSGKSVVADAIREEGAVLIDCDQIGREAVESSPLIRYRLVLAFGPTILTNGDSIDRKELGRLAFSTPEKTAALNAIVHPALLAELGRRLEQARTDHRHAVVDAALLVYWNYHKKMDYTIVVAAAARNRTRRLLAAGLTMAEITHRTKSQLPLSYLKKQADFVIPNDGDIVTVRMKAKTLYHRLISGEKG